MSFYNEKPTWELEEIENNIEHDLFDSIIVENNDIAGFNIHYYVFDPDDSGGDYLFGEYKELKFYGPYDIKVTYKPTNENMNMTGFGLFADDVIQYVYLPITTFNRDIYKDGSIVPYNKPKVGDVIVTLWNSNEYEIVDVGKEDNIFNSKKFVYELILKPFRYSDDSKNTNDIINDDPFNINPDNHPTIDDFGENDKIENESKKIYDYDEDDVQTNLYGY